MPKPNYPAEIAVLPAGSSLAAFAAEQAAALGSDVWALILTADAAAIVREASPDALAASLAPFTRVTGLRVFNARGECRLWNDNGTWKCRRIIDDPEQAEKEDRAVIKNVALWGTETREENGAVVMYEDGRGCRFGFPHHVDKDKLPLQLRLCNYYDYDANGMLDFFDARLIAVTDNKGGDV